MSNLSVIIGHRGGLRKPLSSILSVGKMGATIHGRWRETWRMTCLTSIGKTKRAKQPKKGTISSCEEGEEGEKVREE